MKWTHGLVLAGLTAMTVLPIGAQQPDLIPGQYIPGSVTPLPANPQNLPTLTKDLGTKTGLPDDKIEAVLKEIGPLVAERLARGQGFELKGIGSFRVIRIVAHRQLVGTVAVEVPARNSVEFIPSGGFADRLNRPGAVPGVPVGLPDFNPQPDRFQPERITPPRIESLRVPNTRQP